MIDSQHKEIEIISAYIKIVFSKIYSVYKKKILIYIYTNDEKH
jgi:hypothetical protein